MQSFAEGEVSPELAHLIGQELAEQLLKGQFEVVITTHLNTSHYHNHLVWNSVSMADGKKYHSNAKSYFTEVRRISDDLCRKYGLSVIQTNQGKAMHYAQWKAEAEGKPTWRTAIRMDIRDAIGVSFSWSQFVKEMEKRGYTWKLNRKYPALKTPGYGEVCPSAFLGKWLWGGRDPGEDPASKDPTGVWKNTGAVSKEETYRTSKAVFFLSVSDGSASAEAENGFLMRSVPISENWICASGRWSFCKKKGSTPGKSWRRPGNLWRNRCFP